jgi:hypothetical protein
MHDRHWFGHVAPVSKMVFKSPFNFQNTVFAFDFLCLGSKNIQSIIFQSVMRSQAAVCSFNMFLEQSCHSLCSYWLIRSKGGFLLAGGFHEAGSLPEVVFAWFYFKIAILSDF